MSLKHNGHYQRPIKINRILFPNGVLSKKKSRIPKRLFEIFNEIIDGINFVSLQWQDMDIRNFQVQLNHFDWVRIQVNIHRLIRSVFIGSFSVENDTMKSILKLASPRNFSIKDVQFNLDSINLTLTWQPPAIPVSGYQVRFTSFFFLPLLSLPFRSPGNRKMIAMPLSIRSTSPIDSSKQFHFSPCRHLISSK